MRLLRRIVVKKNFLLLGLLLTSSQFALAQRGGGGGERARPQIPDIDAETMILDIPDKWYPYSRRTDTMVDTYVFPTGQEPADWDETLRQEVFLSTAGITSARQVYELRAENNRGRCERYEAETLGDHQENGYPMFYWRQVCDMSEQTIASLNKVILGNDQLYILSKIWKYEPREREWTRWEEYVEGVYVCDPARLEYRCRPVWPAGAPAGMGGRGR